MRYRVGQRVRVAARPHQGHHRTPGYVKGETGEVVRLHGSFTNPETRAYGDEGLPEQPLYLVGFRRPGNETVFLDLYEHWLEEPSLEESE
jgi:nitrile hydratase subunit beta